MAALLRSARLLKFTPSGLLQVAETKRNGPPLGRLFSVALGGTRSGVCARQISPASQNVLSRVRPYVVGCVRNYTAASERKNDTSIGLQSKQAQEFDWALTKLDSSVRRTGRITKTLLFRVFHDVCRTGHPSGNQALLLLRSCGSLLPEVPLEERTKLAHRVWETLQALGSHYDVSHYNALLKVYLQNEFKFSPMDYLAKMEAASVQPNRVTYQRLIGAYCQNGDIEGASTILGFMKSKDLSITEAVFSSLVTGHARAGDTESAKNILTVMKSTGVEPGPDTYVSLLNAYAEKGETDAMKKILAEAEGADCSLMDREIMQVIFTLAKAGHQQEIPELVKRLRNDRSHLPDTINLCLRLITHGQEDTAFYLLKAALQSDNLSTDSPNLGNFFLRHCVNMDVSVEKLVLYCKALQELNLHSTPLSFTLFCALEAKKSGMSYVLMKTMKEQGLPLRTHYFWPLLTQHMKDHNTAGVVEVLKTMQELEVPLDKRTISVYSLPAFPNAEVAHQVLTAQGVELSPDDFLYSGIRNVAINNLAELYSMLSDPSHPPLDINSFYSSLIAGFRKCFDLENMVKITELLYKDKRYCKSESKFNNETTSFLLYHLMNSMTDREVQVQEDKLRQYFNQLQAKNVTITVNTCRGIKKLLEAYQVPGLIKDVMALIGPKNQESSVPFSAPSVMVSEGNVFALEKRLAELKAENSPIGSVLQQLIRALCTEEKLQRALELQQQHNEEMTVSSYIILMKLCCRHNNVKEALNLKRKIDCKDSSVVLDTSKYMSLVRTLSENGMIEDALDILKEMKEKEVRIDDTYTTWMFHTLAALADNGDVTAIKQLQDTIFSIGLAKPTANLCSPLISAYLNRKDLSGALDAAVECHNRYKHMPRTHDIIVGLVEKGDTELLQKAMDFLSQFRGEMTMLYELFFGFLQTGRYREARKIIETPGLRARPGRLQWFAEKCIFSNQMETLEQMVDMTDKLFECDRDEMYMYILRLCKATNNWGKAEATWTKMQEENVIPRERTLLLLADILKNNGQEVPFAEPETWYKKAEMSQKVKEEPNVTTPNKSPQYEHHITTLCKKGKAQEAYSFLKDANAEGVTLRANIFDKVICSLLAEELSEDAMAVKDIAATQLPGFIMSDTANSLFIISQCKKGLSKDALESLKYMLSQNQVPLHLAITRLVQALGRDGDVAGIQVVESLITDRAMSGNLSRMLFINNRALAHIKNGDVDVAVQELEEHFTRPNSVPQSIDYVFRNVLEKDDDKALDKLSAMAERLANHFACYRPATDLFLQLLDRNRAEDAKFMLARCNAVAEQKKVLLSYLSKVTQTPGKLDRIQNLVSLIPDAFDKKVLYSYLMKCHCLNKDLSSAEALCKQIQDEGIVINELSLKRLAALYRQEGKTVPFTEPPESYKFYADKLKESQHSAEK